MRVGAIDDLLDQIRGERAARAKIAPIPQDSVSLAELRELRAKGLSCREIGEIVGYTREHVSKLLNGSPINGGKKKDGSPRCPYRKDQLSSA